MHSSVFTAINLMFSTNCSYRGGVDIEGRPVMVVVGAHFLLRCLDLERFVLHVVKVIDTTSLTSYATIAHAFVLTVIVS
jgi:hypothetical protein